MIKFGDKFKIRCMMKRDITLSHCAKIRLQLAHHGFQQSFNKDCINPA